ncbi:MAG: hypothetical protein O7G30_17550, partial [Proteobacteria bacterium]|nr:hypothetical protein [Pseudomonadota bacterium]
FTDWLVFNSELEFEHAGTGGGGSVSLEFLTLDFLFDPRVSARAGLLLLPMGLVNEIHEPTFFFGNERPEVERRIIPSTWRENGAGLIGKWGPVHYRGYGVNGLDASGFSVDGFRSGRQKGSRALAEHWAFTGRVDVDVLDGLLLGGSVYVGNSGQNQLDDDTGRPIPDALTTIWELHAVFRRWGATVKGLYAQSHLRDADDLSIALGLGKLEGVARKMNGGYAEFAYEVLHRFFPDGNMTLEPFYRYERLNTQKEAASGFTRNRNFDRRFHVVGLQLKPHPQVVIKLDYRNIDSRGELPIPDEVQIGFGYVF